jgi:hypothetical protein
MPRVLNKEVVESAVAPDIAAALKKSEIAEKEQISGILFF